MFCHERTCELYNFILLTIPYCKEVKFEYHIAKTKDSNAQRNQALHRYDSSLAREVPKP